MFKSCSKCHGIVRLNSKCSRCFKQSTSERNKLYDTMRRDKESTRFYKSKKWVSLRARVLKDYNYIDIYQYIINKRLVKANTVHHIVPLREDRSKALDIDNLIPLSSETHNSIHALYDKGERTKQDTMKILYSCLKSAKYIKK